MKKSFLVLLTVILLVLLCACEKGGNDEKGNESGNGTVTVNPTKEATKPVEETLTPTNTTTPTPTENPKIELRLWCDVTETSAARHAYEMAISELMKRYPDVSLQWSSYESDDYYAMLDGALESGDLPDIFLCRADADFRTIAGLGKLYPLNTAYRDHAENLTEAMCSNMTVNGKKYGVPLTMNVYCMFVNMDILRMAGHEEIPCDLTGLISCCDDVVKNGATPFAFAGSADWYVARFLCSVFEKTCGSTTLRDILYGDQDWYNGDVAGAVDVFNTMATRGFFGADYAEKSYDQAKEDFLQGRCAFFMSDTVSLADYTKAGRIRVSEFPIVNPRMAQSQEYIGGPIEMLSVSAGSENADTAAAYAFELAKLICRYEYLDGYGIPAWKVDYEDPEVSALARNTAVMMKNANRLVPYEEVVMSADDYGNLCLECRKLLSEGIDGKQFVRDLSKQEINDDDLVVFDPDGAQQGGNTDDPNRDLNGDVITISDWWTGDFVPEPSTYEEEVRAAYLREMMEKHHFSIERGIQYSWSSQADELILSIYMNEPIADVVALDYRFIGALMDSEDAYLTDVSKLAEFNFSDRKWNRTVVQSMTVGTAIYAFACTETPTIGVFWNKDLVEQILGADKVDYLYDLQANGQWTWAAFEEFAKQCTRDTNNDGRTDIYGLAASSTNFFEAAILSNGHQLVGKDTSGRFVSNASSQEILEDCDWAYSFYENGYARREGKDENWDFYQYDFTEQRAVMLVAEEYMTSYLRVVDTDGCIEPIFNFGFVCFPKGPNESEYISMTREIMYAIPNCPKTQSRVNDIAFAYNIYTNDPPELPVNETAWRSAYEGEFNDSRSVNETLYLMLRKNKKVSHDSYLIPGLWDNFSGLIQSSLLYEFYKSDVVPEYRLAASAAAIGECVETFNNLHLK